MIAATLDDTSHGTTGSFEDQVSLVERFEGVVEIGSVYDLFGLAIGLYCPCPLSKMFSGPQSFEEKCLQVRVTRLLHILLIGMIREAVENKDTGLLLRQDIGMTHSVIPLVAKRDPMTAVQAQLTLAQLCRERLGTSLALEIEQRFKGS